MWLGQAASPALKQRLPNAIRKAEVLEVEYPPALMSDKKLGSECLFPEILQELNYLVGRQA